MKLSDIKGDRTIDVIAEIIDPIANIAEDADAAAIFKKEKLPEGVKPNKYLADRLRKHLPKLLKGHKGDLIAIMAAIEGTEPQEYAEALDLGKLVRDFIDLLSDEALLAFFTSTGGASGSA